MKRFIRKPTNFQLPEAGFLTGTCVFFQPGTREINELVNLMMTQAALQADASKMNGESDHFLVERTIHLMINIQFKPMFGMMVHPDLQPATGGAFSLHFQQVGEYLTKLSRMKLTS